MLPVITSNYFMINWQLNKIMNTNSVGFIIKSITCRKPLMHRKKSDK
jgi:hypothetical protein